MSMLDCERVTALLDAESERRRVLANNLANVHTPGYKTARVKFEDVFAETSGGEIKTKVVRPNFDNADGTGNDVDLGREVVKLNKNRIRTETYLKFLRFRKKQALSAMGR